MITTTEAIVLKSMKYRETSKIVTFYTRRFGTVSGLAKGARDRKSRFGAALEPMTLVSLVFYKKEQRDLHLISQCDILRLFKRLHSDLDRMGPGMAILELLYQVARNEEENGPLFSLVLGSLEAAENAPVNFWNVYYAFQVGLASIFGFAPAFDHCVSCRRTLKEPEEGREIPFHLGKGGFLCRECTSGGKVRIESLESAAGGLNLGSAAVRIRPATARVLRQFALLPLPEVSTVGCDPPIGNEVAETLRLYLRYHIEDLKPNHSAQLFQNLHP
ncbi:MAG: DNA repair protein RecO [Bacteroidota bacterium]